MPRIYFEGYMDSNIPCDQDDSHYEAIEEVYEKLKSIGATFEITGDDDEDMAAGK